MYTNLLLKNFAPNSANFDKHTELWYKSASLFIPQINKLLIHKTNIKQIEDFNSNTNQQLKQILDSLGSDKANTHNYYILYDFIIKQLGGSNEKLNILEIGLGTNNPSLVSTMGVHGKPGASIKAFKKYLPNSHIYGADIDKNILFNDDRITTSFVDQLDIDTFNNLNNTKYDLIIDDGLHSIGANLNTLIFALENIKNNGWIVIEDIAKHQLENWNIVDKILYDHKNLETYIVNTKHSYLYVVHKL